MLNGTNFKAWKEAIEIILGCMDLGLALRAEKPTPTLETLDEDKVEKWERSNRMCLMIMKRSVQEVFRGSISDSHNAKGKGNIKEYIMKISNLASKLKALKLELSDDLLMHLVLISLPTHFGQFKDCNGKLEYEFKAERSEFGMVEYEYHIDRIRFCGLHESCGSGYYLSDGTGIR
ncbi:uncharacterized protein LOC109807187 [Cajanus cajan]|uniref:uncharacterized protein LOC109807187 n=1 Tax=Cajanus cajan TaxID=3821 RepID=UPI00098DBCFE|nr:uncharacterized protein LOC109807187 [Cajanus cajan]